MVEGIKKKILDYLTSNKGKEFTARKSLGPLVRRD